tara:strand:- start:340 stop:1509 length:1170 start_codon:yes stop_codon:yes gene_type:complete
MKYKRYKICPICENKISKKNIIQFDNFPITEIILKKPIKKNINFKQLINYCTDCHHISLGYQYDQLNFYNENYLNSSHSYSNRHSNEFFLNFVKSKLKKKTNTVMEIGANDLFLLEKFKNYFQKAVAIDPCVRPSKKLKNIKCIKRFISDVKTKDINFTPDVILCSQTLEHIENPKKFIADMVKFGNQNTQYFFQFPSCESLIDRSSFDQLHQQHLNIFSLNSVQKILLMNNFEIINYDFNENHYGSLMIYFKTTKKIRKIKIKKNKVSFTRKYENYKKFMQSNIDIVKKYKSRGYKIYAIGAGLMTPVLNYHLNGLLNLAENILDDDKRKINKFLPNINSKIKSLSKTNIENAVVIITSTASSITVRKLLTILIKKNPKIIIIPALSY